MYRVLVVEDDQALLAALCSQLDAWGYEPVPVRDLRHVAEECAAAAPQLVLMDVQLPYYSGHWWCQQIRQVSDVPVVFLSAAGDDMSIVMGMRLGGDDFLVKPVDPAVLMAKLEAVLRRVYGRSDRLPTLAHRGAVLHLADATVRVGSETLPLTRNEFRILQALMERQGQVVSRDELMVRLWQMDEYVEENTLTQNVNRLRKKLAAAGLTDFITTKVGQGYLVE